MSTNDAHRNADIITAMLQERLVSLIDLSLTLKHVHWNVVGPNFIAVHEMLDPQDRAVRAMVDEVAERIATLGAAPRGTPGAVVELRPWDDYSIGRASAIGHLAALDLVYDGVIRSHREAMDRLEQLDLPSQDLLVGQIRQLELFQWFVRAHLEDSQGHLRHDGAVTEAEAAAAVGGG